MRTPPDRWRDLSSSRPRLRWYERRPWLARGLWALGVLAAVGGLVSIFWTL